MSGTKDYLLVSAPGLTSTKLRSVFLIRAEYLWVYVLWQTLAELWCSVPRSYRDDWITLVSQSAPVSYYCYLRSLALSKSSEILKSLSQLLMLMGLGEDIWLSCALRLLIIACLWAISRYFLPRRMAPCSHLDGYLDIEALMLRTF